jgi:hypothetical protein
MIRLAALLLIFTACGFGKNTTDKTESYNSNASCDASGDKCFNQDATAFEAEETTRNSNPEIDLATLLADEAKVLAAKVLFSSFKEQIKEQAKSIGIDDLDDDEMDKVFDEVIAAAKLAKAKDLDGLISELDPVVMDILSKQPSIAKNIDTIEEKKPQAIMLIKFLLPGLLENGIDSVNVAQVFPMLL